VVFLFFLSVDLYGFDLVKTGGGEQQQPRADDSNHHAHATAAVQTCHEGGEAGQSRSQVRSLFRISSHSFAPYVEYLNRGKLWTPGFAAVGSERQSCLLVKLPALFESILGAGAAWVLVLGVVWVEPKPLAHITAASLPLGKNRLSSVQQMISVIG